MVLTMVAVVKQYTTAKWCSRWFTIANNGLLMGVSLLQEIGMNSVVQMSDGSVKVKTSPHRSLPIVRVCELEYL